MDFKLNDGGRGEHFKGSAGDCVTRAIVIAARLPYRDVYDALADGMAKQRASSRTGKQSRTARNGIYTKRKWFKDYMISLGFVWTPTMFIGSGCTVHLHGDELPPGRLVVAVSKHYTAVIDQTINDTFDPRREKHNARYNDGEPLKPGEWINKGNGYICSISRRCVYGYWKIN